MKQYEVVIQNVEATEESDTKNIQFFAGGKLCNLPENTPVIISEHAYNNLNDSFQMKHKWDAEQQKMVSYKFRRYPMNLIRVIEIPDPEEVKTETVVETPMTKTIDEVVESALV